MLQSIYFYLFLNAFYNAIKSGPVPHFIWISVLSHSCPSLCSPPGSSVHRDSPGKDTGVGCHSLLRGSSQTRELRSPTLQVDSLLSEPPSVSLLLLKTAQLWLYSSLACPFKTFCWFSRSYSTVGKANEGYGTCQNLKSNPVAGNHSVFDPRQVTQNFSALVFSSFKYQCPAQQHVAKNDKKHFYYAPHWFSA